MNQIKQYGNYSIIFAAAAIEQNYDKVKKMAEEIIIYPEDSKVDESDFYELVTWMEEHKDEYGALIMYGADEETEEYISNIFTKCIETYFDTKASNSDKDKCNEALKKLGEIENEHYLSKLLYFKES